MMRTSLACVSVLALVVFTTVGCHEPASEVGLRTAEVDRLDTFTGDWETTYNIKPVGTEKVETEKAIEHYRWMPGERVMVNTWEGTGEEGDFEGVALLYWDPKIDKFRLWQIDNKGEVTTGTAVYHEDSGTWRMKGKRKDCETGKTRIIEATVRVPDEDTLEWESTSWNSWKTKKIANVTAESQRL